MSRRKGKIKLRVKKILRFTDTRVVDPIKIRIGSGFNDFVDPDPDPWARKMKKKCTFS
jgi:hypothetical protein